MKENKHYSILMKNRDTFYKNYLIRKIGMGRNITYIIRINDKTIYRTSLMKNAKAYINSIL